MKKYKILLLIPVILILAGCAERGMLQPLTQKLSANTTLETESNADSLRENTVHKNTVVAQSEVKNIEKDESNFLDKDMQNIIAGTFVALIGLAMLI